MPKRLTETQISDYRRDGFAAPVSVLSADEVRRHRAGLEAFEAGQGKPLDFPERSKSYLLFDWADAITHHPEVLDAVEDLIGPDILVYHLTMHIKEAHQDVHVLWHQDDDYFHLDPPDHVTAWVALSEASEQAGCMRMIPGSSREGLVPHAEKPAEDHLIRLGKGIHDRFAEDDGVPVPLRAGEMSLHNTHTIHASGPNRSDDRRIGVGISYIPAHVKPVSAARTATATSIRKPASPPRSAPMPARRKKGRTRCTRRRPASTPEPPGIVRFYRRNAANSPRFRRKF